MGVPFPAPLGDTKCDLCAELTGAEEHVGTRASVTYMNCDSLVSK